MCRSNIWVEQYYSGLVRPWCWVHDSWSGDPGVHAWWPPPRSRRSGWPDTRHQTTHCQSFSHWCTRSPLSQMNCSSCQPMQRRFWFRFHFWLQITREKNTQVSNRYQKRCGKKEDACQQHWLVILSLLISPLLGPETVTSLGFVVFGLFSNLPICLVEKSIWLVFESQTQFVSAELPLVHLVHRCGDWPKPELPWFSFRNGWNIRVRNE